MYVKSGGSTRSLTKHPKRRQARTDRPWRNVEHIADGVGDRGGEYWTLTLSCGHLTIRSKPVYRIGRRMRTAPQRLRCRICNEKNTAVSTVCEIV